MKKHIFVLVVALAPFMGACSSPSADSDYRGAIENARVADEDPGPWKYYDKNSPWAYLQPGFALDDPRARSMAGNLNTLVSAFSVASDWRPSPADAAAIVASPEYAVLNLWDPYAGGPGRLLAGEPPPSAAPGGFFTWAEEGTRWFAAVTQNVTMTASKPIHERGRNADFAGIRYDTPVERLDTLVLCRVLQSAVKWVRFDFPSVLPEAHPLPETLGDLKAYWWLWDHETLLAGAPVTEAELSVHPRGPGVVVNCETDEGTVWQFGNTDLEREEYANAVGGG